MKIVRRGDFPPLQLCRFTHFEKEKSQDITQHQAYAQTLSRRLKKG